METSPKAYSYLRFSTPEQAQGDSLRRQTEMAEKYAAAHGLELDQSFSLRDLGVSAFRGANAATGALGAFLRAVEAGDVAPGSVLLVEALDRLSRQAVLRAANLLSDIVSAGVDVVTVADGKRYTKQSLEGFDIIMAVLLLFRGREESQTKSRRLKSAWEGKRLKAGERVLTTLVPAWIELDEDRRPQLIEHRAAIVGWIFDQALAGKGRATIASQLNTGGPGIQPEPTWGRHGQPDRKALHWHGSYIAKILRSPAVIGTLVPYTAEHDEGSGRVLRVAQAPVLGYFPPAVDREKFERVQALLTRGAPRGRHAVGPLQNLLARLARCPKCGNTMTRVQKGERSQPYLVCTKAKAKAGCEYHAVRMHDVETAIRRDAKHLCDERPPADPHLAEGVRAIDGERGNIEAAIWTLTEELAYRPSPAIRQRLHQLESRNAELLRMRREIDSKVVLAEPKLVKRRIERLKKALTSKVWNVQEANVALRECFEQVTISYESGGLQFQWRHGGVTELMYASSRVFRKLPDDESVERAERRIRRRA